MDRLFILILIIEILISKVNKNIENICIKDFMSFIIYNNSLVHNVMYIDLYFRLIIYYCDFNVYHYFRLL